MWKCLSCERENSDDIFLCPCGFDESKNYKQYFTLTELVNSEKESFVKSIAADTRISEYSFIIGSNAAAGKCDHALKKRWLSFRNETNEGQKWNMEGNLWYFAVNRECDYEKAASCYKKAEEFNDLDGINNLGNCYYYGNGIGKNEKLAVQHYKKGAEYNHGVSQYNLAYCYEHGTGEKKDELAAFMWYLKAGKNGIVKAQKRLGDYYLNRDMNEAIYWYKNAAEAGDVYSQLFLKMIIAVEKK